MRKIPRNSQILSNTCLYNILETYFSYWIYLLAVNLQIYLRTLSLKHANNIPKLPGVDNVVKSWALVMMLKALPLVHFWSVLLLKEQMMTSVRKMLKTLVWSAQSWLIPSKICLGNNHKIGCFLLIALWWSLPRKLPRNYCKIGQFFHELVPKNPANLTFLLRPVRSPDEIFIITARITSKRQLRILSCYVWLPILPNLIFGWVVIHRQRS